MAASSPRSSAASRPRRPKPQSGAARSRPRDAGSGRTVTAPKTRARTTPRSRARPGGRRESRGLVAGHEGEPARTWLTSVSAVAALGGEAEMALEGVVILEIDAGNAVVAPVTGVLA